MRQPKTLKARIPKNSIKGFNNLVDKVQRQATEKRSKWVTNEALASYIGSLDDVCVQAIERMCEHIKQEKVYSKDANLRSLIDELTEAAKKRDERLAGVATDVEFYADLRDGAMEYMEPTIKELNEGFTVIARCMRTLRSTMAGELMTCYSLVQNSLYSATAVISVIEKNFCVKVSGAESFLMYEEMDILRRLTDKLHTYHPALQPSVSALLDKVMVTTRPANILPPVVAYLKKYHAGEPRFQSFSNTMKELFNVKI